MPELPDVEVYKRCLDSAGVGRRVAAVHVRDDRLLEKVSSSTLRRRLKSRRLTGSRRHGKLLFAAVEGDADALVMHFGMTGSLSTFAAGEAAPAHSAVVLDFANGHRLAYTSMRKLGRLGLTRDVDGYLREKNLGLDALDEALDLGRFRELLGGRTGSIKGALMDQSLIAGIGNVYSDEMLLRARVHPAHPADGLGDRAWRALHRAMGEVLRKAIEAQAQPGRMPRWFLLPDRREGAPCPACGGTIGKRRIAGRSSYFCPACLPS